jgi:hypothetical protein
VILRKLDDGTLPTQPPTVYAGYGSGATCDACAAPIHPAEVEFKLDYPDVQPVLRLHFRCAAVWEALRRERGLDPAL